MMCLAVFAFASTDAEFVLTENCYIIYEGPSTFCTDPTTGEIKDGVRTSYHEFSPISPRLMIILRRVLLPSSEEDANESVE